MNKEFKIAVIDGQGGGIGKTIIETLKKEDLNVEIIALGTNSVATSRMLKSGADAAATGENAIIFNSKKADIIVGVLGLLVANSMLGEVTKKIAEAIGKSEALKVLIPLEKCKIIITTPTDLSLQENIDNAVKIIKSNLN
jgi:aspartate-semialdehyde dehydrogenase